MGEDNIDGAEYSVRRMLYGHAFRAWPVFLYALIQVTTPHKGV